MFNKFTLTSSLLALLAPSLASAAATQSEDLLNAGDTFYYGDSQPGVPAGMMEVAGFPVAGETIELRLAGARPGAATWFMISLASANSQLPGFGNVLVDASQVASILTTADNNGYASALLDIPATFPVGANVYFQSLTYDASASPQSLLSDAAEISVGDSVEPYYVTTYLEGSLDVSGIGGVGNATGLLSRSYSPTATPGEIEIEAGVHLDAPSFQYNGAFIENLHIFPGDAQVSQLTQIGGGSSGTAVITGDFSIGYDAVGVGDYATSTNGMLILDQGIAILLLDPIVDPQSGPINGAAFTYVLNEERNASSVFEMIAELALPADGSNGSLVTFDDVDNALQSAEDLMNAWIAGVDGGEGFFNPDMPSYSELIALEREILSEFTEGEAETVEEMMMMVSRGEMSLQTAQTNTWVAKLLAGLGIYDGWTEFRDLLLERCGGLLGGIGSDIDAGRYGDALDKIVEILDNVVSADFGKEFAQRVGKKRAGKILAGIGARCVPFIGWAWTGGCILWAVIEQWL